MVLVERKLNDGHSTQSTRVNFIRRKRTIALTTFGAFDRRFCVRTEAHSLFSRFFMSNFHFRRIKSYLPKLSSKWNLITEFEIFAKESYLSNQILLKKIPDNREIQFSKKKQCNETMKNEANQDRFFLENQILWQIRMFFVGSDC